MGDNNTLITANILIIDDDKRQRNALAGVLAGQNYILTFAENGREGILKAKELSPDAILLDVMMPDMDGYQVCRLIRKDPLLAEVPIFFLSSLEDQEDRIRGIEAGADEFISKPFNVSELRARLRNVTQLNRYQTLQKQRFDLEEAKKKVLDAYDATIQGWAKALELRDHETKGHSDRVVEKTIALAWLMGIPEEELVDYRRGALLHDIGKIGIPDHILLKPGPLNEEEWEITRRHPVWALEFIQTVEFLKQASTIPYCHHEKWDGTGYPAGLKGQEIPLAARIFSIVDVWDALSNDRPYRKALTENEILDYIKKQSGIHFDPDAVENFIRLIEMEKTNQLID